MMIIHIKSKYLDEDATLKFSHFSGGQIALQLFDANTTEPLITATVNLSSNWATPAEGNLMIKNIWEAEGLVEGLIKAGVINQIIQPHVIKGTVPTAYECSLTPEAWDEYINQVGLAGVPHRVTEKDIDFLNQAGMTF